MTNSVVNGLKVVFTTLGLALAVILAYTLSVDGNPFRREYLQPWLVITVIDFYAHVAILAAWIIYKEPNWIRAILWIILFASVGSIATCVYVVTQLVKLSGQENNCDPIYHALLRRPNKNKNSEQKAKHVPVVAGRVVFSVLGFWLLGDFLYILFTYYSLFLQFLTSPWALAAQANFHVTISAIAVWVAYKESSAVSAVLWILMIYLFGGMVTCIYMLTQLSGLSSQDPLYLVLFRSGGTGREEGKYE